MSADSRMPAPLWRGCGDQTLRRCYYVVKVVDAWALERNKGYEPGYQPKECDDHLKRNEIRSIVLPVCVSMVHVFFPCVGLKELTQISAARFPPATQSS